jgi:hypothetical protein
MSILSVLSVGTALAPPGWGIGKTILWRWICPGIAMALSRHLEDLSPPTRHSALPRLFSSLALLLNNLLYHVGIRGQKRRLIAHILTIIAACTSFLSSFPVPKVFTLVYVGCLMCLLVVERC